MVSGQSLSLQGTVGPTEVGTHMGASQIPAGAGLVVQEPSFFSVGSKASCLGCPAYVLIWETWMPAGQPHKHLENTVKHMVAGGPGQESGTSSNPLIQWLMFLGF